MNAPASIEQRIDVIEALFLDLDPVTPGSLGWSPRLAAIIADAARLTGQPASSITGAARNAPVVRARFAVIWAARRVTGFSYPQIGRALGDRDHTSICHGYKAAERLRGCDPDFRVLSDILVDRATRRRDSAAPGLVDPDPAKTMRDRCIALVEAAPCATRSERQLKREIVSAMRGMALEARA